MSRKTVNVLLVEDDDIDVESIKRAFRKMKIANPMTVVSNGIEALEKLRGNREVAPLERPYIILLDLNMPRMNGIEFLKEIRKDEQLRDSIVFVLTTSQSDEDKVAAYSQNIAGYTVKEEVGQAFIRLVGMLDSFWRVVELPEKRV